MRILFFILVSIFISQCSKPNLEDVKVLTDEKEYPSETAYNIEYIYSDSAKVKAKLKAPYMEKYESDNPYIEMSKGMNVTFFDRDKQPSSFLKADYGIRYDNKKITEAKGNVVVVTTNGDTLTTEHLVWNEKKNKVFSKSKVRVRTEDEIIYAEEFETDPDFNEYKFKKVIMTINLKDD